jgi:uncharacterized protein YuzE
MVIKTSYDPEADAIFIWLGPEGVISAETKEVSPGVMLDYDASGRLIGIEVLDVRDRARIVEQNEFAAE